MADGQPPAGGPKPPPVPPRPTSVAPRPAAWPTAPVRPAAPRPPAVPPPLPRPRVPSGPPPAAPDTATPGFALDVAAVLERTFSAWRANIAAFTALGFLLLGPVYLIEFFVQSRAAAGNVALDRFFVAMLLSGLAQLVLTGAIPFGVYEHMRGRDHDAVTILVTGFSRFFPVLGTAIVTAIATYAAAVAFCLPALFVAAMYYVSVPVTVIEEENPFGAVSRSFHLTKGNVMRVMGLMILLTVSLGAAMLAFRIALGAAMTSKPAAELVAKLLLVPLASLDGIARAVTYHDLRQGREHSSVDELVKVFE